MSLSPELVQAARAQFESLPKTLQDVLQGNLLVQVLDKIKQAHDLSPADETLLYNNVTLVLLGFLPQTQLKASLAEALSVSKTAVDIIVSTLEKELFFLVENELAEVAGLFSTTVEKSSVSTDQTNKPVDDSEQAIQPTPSNANTHSTPPTEINSPPVAPVRTMSRDQAHVTQSQPTSNDEGTVHRSTQDALLQRDT